MLVKRKDGMYLDISKISQDEFRINEENGLIFVGPKKNKWTWVKEERWLRSIILNSEGKVVSSGWPKFGNYGEFLDETEVLNIALKNNSSVKFSHKEDGSLCIRSIIDNNLVLRTRGTMLGQFAMNDEGPTFYEKFYTAIEDKYPKLLDLNFYSDLSLLFEYVSPTNRIVLKYEDTDLIFIGAIKHSDLTLITWEKLVKIAKEGKLNLVKLHTLPTDPKELVKTVHKGWVDKEGIVARCNNDQVMVKIKSEDYLAKHRTKATMNYDAASIIIRNEEIITPEDMDRYCQDKDFDWELGQDMLRYLKEYKEAVRVADLLIKKAVSLVKEFKEEYPEVPEGKIRKKKFAIFIRSEKRHVKSVCFSLFDGKELDGFMDKLIKNKGVGYEI